ncbi:AlpA family transcriptional regulator [Bradyrhizobium sp. Leo170]|nr:AlpA family transcriptional regulator [Bradyrhizobium sp. Leo170]
MIESDRIVRIQEVVKITGLSRRSIYRAMVAGIFPKQVDVGMRAAAWMLSDVQAWLSSRQTAGWSA